MILMIKLLVKIKNHNAKILKNVVNCFLIFYYFFLHLIYITNAFTPIGRIKDRFFDPKFDLKKKEKQKTAFYSANFLF